MLYSLDKLSNYYCSRFARTIKHLEFVSGNKAALFYRLRYGRRYIRCCRKFKNTPFYHHYKWNLTFVTWMQKNEVTDCQFSAWKKNEERGISVDKKYFNFWYMHLVSLNDRLQFLFFSQNIFTILETTKKWMLDLF